MFRKHFAFSNLACVNWFPGHMAKGMRDLGRKLRFCDCVIEVHDAREVLDTLRRKGEREVVFTNCKDQYHPSVEQLMATIQKIADRPEQSSINSSEGEVKLMVVGMPNVGKSSLINSLRRKYLKKGKAALVGKLPGITRSVTTRIMISNNPPMYVVDTPGVMIPNIPNSEVALKLAATGMFRDHQVGEQLIADYILFLLNNHKQFEYVRVYDLLGPCDDIEIVLGQMATRLGAQKKGGEQDLERAARHFISSYRDGRLGSMTLDSWDR
eukprot:Em0011g643a